MKKLLCTILLVVTSFGFIYSQEFYIPDLPGYTYNSQSIGHKNMDVEMGFGYSYQHYGSRNDLYYNTTAVRYGLFKFMELRGEIDFGNLKNNGDNYQGVSGVLFGAKFPIHINDSIVKMAIVGSCYLPKLGQEYFQYPDYSPQLTLALQKNVGKCILFGNLGGVWNGFNPSLGEFINFQETASAAIYYFPSNLGIFIETYHKFSKGNPAYNNFDCGLVYVFSDNFVCDFSVGLNYKEGSDDSFVNLGLAWRILN